MSTDGAAPRRPRVVIIGGGFGGLMAAKALAKTPADVTLIDRTNHHLFQPLLYQVATAGLAPSDITVPIRWVVRKQKNTTVFLGEVERVDVNARQVMIRSDPRPIPYDYLILATGSRHAYFGHDEWEPIAPGLKSIEDALEIRRRFLIAFEEAEHEDDPAARQALTTFVVIGGGPTGVELAGMMAEIARKAMPPDFRRIDTRATRIILLEGGPRLLPAFPERLAEHARRDLERLGAEVRTSTRVTAVRANGVLTPEGDITARTVFWAAGNLASPLTRDLGTTIDRVGRVSVLPDLSVAEHREVFVVGDLAIAKRADGSSVPGVAQGAMQGGVCAARNIGRSIRGEATQPFRYFNKGDMATIGRNRAIADFGWATMAGFPAWLLWVFIHITYLIGFRNRASVLVQWAYAYFTFQRGVRLIHD